VNLSLFGGDLLGQIRALLKQLDSEPFESRVGLINEIREELHKYSPFASEPVDCIRWIRSDLVTANDYNPNSVAPPEMKLLEHSIREDGYTQPIVSWRHDGVYEVVDGFHRHRVGKESAAVRKRIKDFLPLVVINGDREDRNDRIAATIRHNRARGKHKVEGMSDIVIELKRRNWTDDRIARELGMDQDEILRLCQITGLAELFSDQEFSRSWDVEGKVTESDFKELTDDVSTYGEEAEKFRTVNTGDANRIFHTYEKWECYKAGFYSSSKDGMTKAQCEEGYRSFLADTARFSDALEHVITEWKHSCEHYLTNGAMNRIAWLGQAACCYATGIPSEFRSGFFLLSPEQQQRANETALIYLNKWLAANGRETVTMDQAYPDRQADIY
jgi:ParB-like chromosome segregation protein Spo0J